MIKKTIYTLLCLCTMLYHQGHAFDAVQKLIGQHVDLSSLQQRYGAVKDVSSIGLSAIKQLYYKNLLKNSTLISKNPYRHTSAQVRIGSEIPSAELEFLHNRMPRVKHQLEQVLGKKLTSSFVPKIAVLNSGGGQRALISSIGLHIGLEQIGLLDALTYVAGVSGGSWFTALWLVSGMKPSDFKVLMQPIARQGLNPGRFSAMDSSDYKRVADAFMVRHALKQPTTLVTLWGALLANRYLAPYGDLRERMLFSDLANATRSGRIPLPILTAVNGYDADTKRAQGHIGWFAFTPFESGAIGNWLGYTNIPTWAVGRRFERGRSIDTNPGYDLGQLMGICGSAFAFSMARAFQTGAEKIPLVGPVIYDIIAHLLPKNDREYIQGKRLSTGKIPNFALGNTHIPRTSAPYSQPDIKLVDAALAFNVPYPPVSGMVPGRKADIMIFCDASGTSFASELRGCQRYAQAHNLPFPPINYTHIDKRPISIFKDPRNPAAPIIIYITRHAAHDLVSYPAHIDKKYSTKYKTSKFKYIGKEYNNLIDVLKTNVTAHKQQILKEIDELIQRKGGYEQ